jgi:phosphosulfolactate synthase
MPPPPDLEGTSMRDTTLTLPGRADKPRLNGITMVIDGGLPTAYFIDLVESHGELIDVVKFGWGTALVTADLQRKIDALAYNGVDFYFGGTLFEKFLVQDQFDQWRAFVDGYGASTVEISNGTIDLSNERKAEYVARLVGDYRVFSEVGFKDSGKSETMGPELWLEYIQQDLDAGAVKVITEARESGTSGIASANGQLKKDLVEQILESGIDADRLMFEAPNKQLQTYLITRVGSNVNLGNIAPADVVPLETLRLGLRGDTLIEMEALTHA